MKQNERWLVYAVSGFLGLILVVAVLFRPKTGNGDTAATPGLAQILNQEVAAKEADAAKSDAIGRSAADASMAGLPAPTDIAPQPLSAMAPKPLAAADRVAQQLGLSRRDRNVRFVRAKPNDSLDSLVRRWCGARDPYYAETKSLNEDLEMLRVGQEIAVPWVDDEVLDAALEASKPKTLTAETPVPPALTSPGSPAAGAPTMQPVAGPSFAQPVVSPATNSPATNSPATNETTPTTSRSGAATLATGTSYTFKAGESLWSVAARTYGRKNADKMIAAMKQANPGLTENVREGQKIVLPSAPTAN